MALAMRQATKETTAGVGGRVSVRLFMLDKSSRIQPMSGTQTRALSRSKSTLPPPGTRKDCRPRPDRSRGFLSRVRFPAGPQRIHWSEPKLLASFPFQQLLINIRRLRSPITVSCNAIGVTAVGAPR